MHIFELAAADSAANGVEEVAGSGAVAEVAGAATGAGIAAAISTVLVALIHVLPRLREQSFQLKAYREHKEFMLEVVKLLDGNVTVAEVALLLAAGPTVGSRTDGSSIAQKSTTAEEPTEDGSGPGPDLDPPPPRLRSVGGAELGHERATALCTQAHAKENRPP